MAYQIKFHSVGDKSSLSAGGKCYICGATSYRRVLRVEKTGQLVRDLEMVECHQCHSLYFSGDDTVIGYDADGFEEEYWYNYVQNGAGITAMLAPLLGIKGLKGGSLLDVGCGFGFVPHFWTSMGYGEAIGLETSRYGRVGADLLQQEIIPSYYADAAAIAGRKFDFVFSSEVIEHVPDPKSFILEIAQGLSDNGILILTTPSADAVRPDCTPTLIGAVLSPGFHYFVAKADALEKLVRDCGFPHVRVENTGERLFVWASRAPLPETTSVFSDWDSYLRYLEIVAAVDNPHVRGGALYRAFKDSVNLGEFDRAKQLFEPFLQLALDTYQIDFMNPGVSAVQRAARTGQDYKIWPSWLGCGFLSVALYLKHCGSDRALIAGNLQAAIDTMLMEIELGEQFAQEPAYFLPSAEQELESLRVETEATRVEDEAAARKIRTIRSYDAAPAGRDICLFVSYAPDGIIRPATLDHIKALKANAIDVILCVAVEDISAHVAEGAVPAEAEAILWRENGGFDFAVWAAVLALKPDLWSAKRLYMVNDSVIVIEKALSSAIDQIRASSADFIGMTESIFHCHHAQSYFFVLQSSALKSAIIRRFWREVKTLATKEDVIKAYELTLLDHVKRDTRLQYEIMFSFEKLFPNSNPDDFSLLNPTHNLWERLIECGFPFIKIELIYRNPLLLNIDHLPEVAARHGANMASIQSYLVVAPRPAPVELDYVKWPNVRRWIGEKRFHAIRDLLRARRLKRRAAAQRTRKVARR